MNKCIEVRRTELGINKTLTVTTTIIIMHNENKQKYIIGIL